MVAWVGKKREKHMNSIINVEGKINLLQGGHVGGLQGGVGKGQGKSKGLENMFSLIFPNRSKWPAAI